LHRGHYEVGSGVSTDAARTRAAYGLDMSRSAAVSLLFEAVMPALGFALVLGASLLPALAVAVAATAAIVAVMHVVSP
jgi:hypothetical protein